MTTEEKSAIEQASELNQNTADSKLKKTTPRKPKWQLMIGASALFIGGTVAWSLISSSPESTVEVSDDIEQARLTVKTVTANLEPIQAWSYGDGFVSAITKKHLTFQAEGTIDYLKKIDGRDLREGDRVRKGELLARVDRRKYDADITVASAGQIEAKNQVLNAIASFEQAKESLAQAQTDLEKAKTDEAFAQADLKRYQDLAAEGAVEQ